MFYVKSIYTNQVFKVENLPKFEGYEVVDKTEYEDWCLKTFGQII